jgi:hypothetical protein
VKKPGDGTGRTEGFAVELEPRWERWARRRTEAELAEIAAASHLADLAEVYLHCGVSHRCPARLAP